VVSSSAGVRSPIASTIGRLSRSLTLGLAETLPESDAEGKDSGTLAIADRHARFARLFPAPSQWRGVAYS